MPWPQISYKLDRPAFEIKRAGSQSEETLRGGTCGGGRLQGITATLHTFHTSPCHQFASIAIFLSARLLFPVIIACHVNFTLFTFLDTHQAKMWQGLEFLTFPLVTNSADSIQLEGS